MFEEKKGDDFFQNEKTYNKCDAKQKMTEQNNIIIIKLLWHSNREKVFFISLSQI